MSLVFCGIIISSSPKTIMNLPAKNIISFNNDDPNELSKVKKYLKLRRATLFIMGITTVLGGIIAQITNSTRVLELRHTYTFYNSRWNDYILRLQNQEKIIFSDKKGQTLCTCFYTYSFAVVVPISVERAQGRHC